MKPTKYRLAIRGIIIGFWVAIAGFVPFRIHEAKSYMQFQIDRLALNGTSGYEIYETDYFSYADYFGFACLTVKARRKDSRPTEYGDGYHYIEIDFPWVPFNTPVHRI